MFQIWKKIVFETNWYNEFGIYIIVEIETEMRLVVIGSFQRFVYVWLRLLYIYKYLYVFNRLVKKNVMVVCLLISVDIEGWRNCHRRSSELWCVYGLECICVLQWFIFFLLIQHTRVYRKRSIVLKKGTPPDKWKLGQLVGPLK